MRTPEREYESLDEEVKHIESESRMILPGIQALFGFQLVAVFNERFEHALSYELQLVHWMALACTAVATIFIVTPAAFHRLAEPHKISSKFSRIANACVTVSLFPMMVGCVADFYLIGRIITHDPRISFMASAVLFFLFVLFWYIFPLIFRKRTKVH